MEERLQFPEKNRVSVSISKDTVLREAIFGEKQVKVLQQSLEFLKLLYTFPYRDGEVVVLQAEINDTVQERYHLAEISNAVQLAVPYPMLLIIKCEYVVKFYFNDEEETTLDRTKVASHKQICTKDIILNALRDSDYHFLGRLRADLENAVSVTSLCDSWSQTVGKYRETDAYADEEESFFQESLVHSRVLLQRDQFRGYTLEEGRRFLYEETDEVRLFPGRALDVQNDWEHQLFLDYCCGHARSLYRQSENLQTTEEKWLWRYITACSVYAYGLYARTLSNDVVRQIISAFYEGEEPAPDDDAADYYSEAYLKDLMGTAYFSDSIYSMPPMSIDMQ